MAWSNTNMMQYGQFGNQGGFSNPAMVQNPYMSMGNSGMQGGFGSNPYDSQNYSMGQNGMMQNPSMGLQSGMSFNPYDGSNYSSGLWSGSNSSTSGYGSSPPSSSSWFNPQTAGSAVAGIGGSLAGLFNNPYQAAQGQLSSVPGYLQNAYGPYMQNGQQLMGQLTGQFNQLAQNPAANLAAIGRTYQSSPGYNFQVGQATGAADRSAAAGGMVGSGANQVQTAGIANQLANQDYNQYMQNALGVQGQGLQGLAGLEGQGYNAASNYGMGMSNYSAEQAGLAAQAAQNKNNSIGGFFGSLFGLV